MKSKLTKVTLIFSLILSFGCTQEDKDSVEALVKENLPESEVQLPEVAEDIPQGDEDQEFVEEDVVMVAQEYSFMDGKCLNEDELEGYNIGVFGPCGDLSYQNLDDLNFKHATDLSGLNIEGAYITNSWIDVETIVFFEMKYNEDTQISGISNLEVEIIDEYKEQKDELSKGLQVKLKIIEKLRDLISKLLESDKPNIENQLIQKQKLLDSKLKKYYADLEKVNRLQAYIDSQEN